MTKIPQAVLVEDFKRMYREHWKYTWGHNETGNVDCSGAFVWAYREHGLSIYNGSNRIARVYISGSLIPFAEAKKNFLIVPGMAAFKSYQQSNAKWNLKSTYMLGGKYYNGDTLDHHHIGLVDDDVGYILNAQSSATGFVRSKAAEKWDYVAFLKDVDYGDVTTDIEKGETTVTAKVVNGSLNMRESKSTLSTKIVSIPEGKEISVLDSTDATWWKVSYGGKTGYVMSKYLMASGSATVSREEFDTLKRTVNELSETQKAILSKIGGLG